MPFSHSDLVEVRQIPRKGRGVFARCAIAEGQEIERVPVLVLPSSEVDESEEWAGLSGYWFYWGRGRLALALGYGSLYNHSYAPNARYLDVGKRTKVFLALRDIASGEEITINYNGDPADTSPVGFDVVDSPAQDDSTDPLARGA